MREKKKKERNTPTGSGQAPITEERRKEGKKERRKEGTNAEGAQNAEGTETRAARRERGE